MLAVAVAVCLVSVAYGLLVGPSGTQVAFPTTIVAHSAAPADLAPVSVQVTQGAVGRTTSATLERGGQAARTAASNAGEGFVGFRKARPRVAAGP